MNRYTYFKHSNLIEGVEDEKAVEKNIDALNYLISEGELTEETVKKVHEIIMENRQPEIAGEYKEQENWVMTGREAKIFCPPGKVGEKMHELLKYIPENSLEVLKFHASLEAVHPFLDGNGRVGRVIMYYQFQEVLGVTPIMFRNDDKQGYYDMLESMDRDDLFVDPEIEYRPISEFMEHPVKDDDI